MNRRLRDNKSALQMPLSLIKAVKSSSFFTKKKRTPTRVLMSTSFGHYNGGIGSSEEVTKSFLFFFLNRLAD